MSKSINNLLLLRTARWPRLTPYSLLLTPYFLLLPACGVLPSEAPPIRDATLIEVLVELHLLEARFEVYEDLPSSLRDSVFARYGVDSTAFNATLHYYARYPQRYNELYLRVIDRLTAEAGEPEGTNPQ